MAAGRAAASDVVPAAFRATVTSPEICWSLDVPRPGGRRSKIDRLFGPADPIRTA
jgi:hypothetical protein